MGYEDMTRDECIEAVSQPGKFEHQQPYVPYYWGMYLEGWYASERKGVVGFYVDRETRVKFPELGDLVSVYLVEDDQGFVREV